ncbi:uncharacterized protein [Zea mays]|uniref:PHD-type zinc finger plants domain-containing protein n=1 Tax=Zea mays TaxID=4577 RepID=A0A804PIQ5_MAIZE|nr:uncharacterized protein LOC103627320 [Zea mays]|eukprot:XP_008645849.1 uncharacterized protein LOC103627320 [Zea mays]
MASSLGSDDSAGSAAAVCCMCGDHGLPLELYRCDLCRIRTQHRYCSDLYPAAAAAGPYRSCNWCLRQGGADVGGGCHSPSPVNKVSAAAGTGTRRRISINGSRGDGESATAMDAPAGQRSRRTPGSRSRSLKRAVKKERCSGRSRCSRRCLRKRGGWCSLPSRGSR